MDGFDVCAPVGCVREWQALRGFLSQQPVLSPVHSTQAIQATPYPEKVLGDRVLLCLTTQADCSGHQARTSAFTVVAASWSLHYGVLGPFLIKLSVMRKLPLTGMCACRVMLEGTGLAPVATEKAQHCEVGNRSSKRAFLRGRELPALPIPVLSEPRRLL